MAEEVAGPIAGEVHRILTEQRAGVLTLGVVLALYFSSSGVESLRVGLNRAYGIRETRRWWVTRLESIAYVLCGAMAMLAFAVLVVFGPLVWRALVYRLPGLEPFGLTAALLRLGTATIIIVTALVIAHKFIAAGRRPVRLVLPGIGVTLVLWLVAGLGFGWYLDNFADAYVSTYGGLATAMVALIFLYWLAAFFLFGGEINGTVIAARRRRLRQALQDAKLRDVISVRWLRRAMRHPAVIVGLPRSRRRRCEDRRGTRRPHRHAAPARTIRHPSLSLASITSSKVRRPARGALTSTAMLPGACWFFHILVCAIGILSQGKTSHMHGSMRRSSTNWLAAGGLLQMGEMRALDALLAHPDDSARRR